MNNYIKALYDDYEKILLVDLNNNTFKPIKISPSEEVNYVGLNQWFIEFANSNMLNSDDREDFLNFVNIFSLKERLIHKTKISTVYRRNGDRWFVISILKTEEKNQYLLTVKDIQEEHIKMVSDSNKKYCYDIKELEHFKERIEDGASCGFILLEFKEYDEEEIINVLKYYYSNKRKFKDNHRMLIVFPNIDCNEFEIELSQFYRNLNDFEVTIGAFWRDEEIDIQNLLEESKVNLENNKKR